MSEKVTDVQCGDYATRSIELYSDDWYLEMMITSILMIEGIHAYWRQYSRSGKLPDRKAHGGSAVPCCRRCH